MSDAEVAFMCSASDEMLEVLEAGAWNNSQEPTMEIGADTLALAALGGIVALFRHGNVVVCLSRQTAWVGRIDVFMRPGTTMAECVRAGRAFMEWAPANTRYARLEARSPQRFIYTVGRRCGWRLDAIIPGSYADANGAMQSEYLMGWTRPEGDTSWSQQSAQSLDRH